MRIFEHLHAWEAVDPGAPPPPDHYAALGVAPDADAEAVHAAYRARVRAAHPDKGGSAEEFARVKAAHDVVGCAESRCAYDEVREAHGARGVHRLAVPLAAVYADSYHAVPYYKAGGALASVQVRVPAGTRPFARIVSDAPGAPSGQVAVVVRYLPSEQYHVDGADVSHRVRLGLPEVLCGAPFTVRRPDGFAVRAAAPLGRVLSPGTVWELPGHGLPCRAGGRAGALRFTVDVVFPAVVNRDAAASLGAALGGAPPPEPGACVAPEASATSPDARAGGPPSCAQQ